MARQFLHVFRNTPFGRETLTSSAYFCERAEADLQVYVPRHSQFLMYFDAAIVTVDLDRAFLRSPETARERVDTVLADFDVAHTFLEPAQFTASTLPDVPPAFDVMCCPRSISDLSTKVGLGYIGPRVRSIVQEASFPVLLPTPVCKRWNSIVCFFGGSSSATTAVRWALDLHRTSGAPMQLFTQAGRMTRDQYRERLSADGCLEPVERAAGEWLFFDEGRFVENLYAVPQDALVVVGAYGHGLARELVFGSTMETIQTVLPNPMLIVGPRCRV